MEHGSPNITSKHKQTILLISAADFVTSNIDLYTAAPLPFDLMRDTYIQTALKEDDLSFYQTDFLDTLKKDELFLECQSLFGLKD